MKVMESRRLGLNLLETISKSDNQNATLCLKYLYSFSVIFFLTKEKENYSITDCNLLSLVFFPIKKKPGPSLG